MDLEFKGDKLSLNLSPEETGELVSTIPDSVLIAEVQRRNLIISAGVGEAALEGAAEPGADHEVGSGTIRRPILKQEFMRYVDSRMADGEERQVRAQKGVVSRTWYGFIYLHKTANDFGKKIDADKARRTIGVAVPSFEDIHFNQEYLGSAVGKRYVLDIDHTDGLDMDQAARYLLGILDTIREHNSDGQPIEYTIAQTVISRVLPSYSFVGCQLLCEFLALKAKQEGGLPEDIEIEAIELAAKDFAIVAQQTSKNVFLKGDELPQPLTQDDVRRVLDILPAGRERNVMTLLYGLEDGQPRTIEEVARDLGVTKYRARQVLRTAELKVRAVLRQTSQN